MEPWQESGNEGCWLAADLFAECSCETIDSPGVISSCWLSAILPPIDNDYHLFCIIYVTGQITVPRGPPPQTPHKDSTAQQDCPLTLRRLNIWSPLL